jgi:predicted RNase H-like HicB family nuclease
MSRKFNVIIEQDEDGYFVGLVPELPGCHTQAKSLDVLQKRLKEAIQLYLCCPDSQSGRYRKRLASRNH